MIFNVCINEGKGAVYSFDPVGSYQRDTYKAGGSASSMLQPLLDNQVNGTPHSKHVLFKPVKTFSTEDKEQFFNTGLSMLNCFSTDWFQKHGGGSTGSLNSGEGSSAGYGRLHLCCRERCVHWWCPPYLHRHKGRHWREDRPPEEGLRRPAVPFFHVILALYHPN